MKAKVLEEEEAMAQSHSNKLGNGLVSAVPSDDQSMEESVYSFEDSVMKEEASGEEPSDESYNPGAKK